MADLTVQELFEAQAARTPGAVALRSGEIQLTYRELNERSNQLAHHLIGLGVGPEIVVGIYMTRGPELLIALLAVFKAGGAFLPLDPEHPIARLSFMIEDGSARYLLTHAPLLGRLSAERVTVVSLDLNGWLAPCNSWHSPARRGGPDSLAYLMYTSGSTGRPKGILVPHRGLVNYLTWCLTAYPVTAGTGAPVHSSVAFDLTLTGLFVPLLAGRTVYMLPPGNPIDLLRAAFRAGCDFSLVKITPAHFELLGQVLEPHEASGRTRAFVIGGENLTDRHLSFWQEFAPDTLLVNEYGPTETVVGCSVYFLPPGKAAPGSVPIGRPIANTALYVLDDGMHPVEPGAPGELYIGGVGVARGYLNRPDLTAECFVPDPFGGEPGGRLYRTGDLVRVLPDGNLEFLCRIDSQVKLHGFRIETGEVEAALHALTAVRRAVVLVREEVVGERRLVAYIVPHGGQTVTASDLRQALRDRLPEFMVPSDWVVLAELPLTPNGKVDLRALPAPLRVASAGVGSEVPVGDGPTVLMIGLWEEVLGIRPIGVRDNFFDMGGDSFQAVRLFARIRKVFGRDLPLASLLEAPTAEQLLRVLEASATPGVVSLVPLHTEGSRATLFCIPGAGGDVFTFHELAGLLGPDQPVSGLQTHWQEKTLSSLRSLEELAALHLEVIRSAQPNGPYFLCGFSFGGTLAFETARQLAAQGQRVAFLAVIDQAARTPVGRGRFWYGREVLKHLPRWVCTDLWRMGPIHPFRRLGSRAAASLGALMRVFQPDPSPAGTVVTHAKAADPIDRRDERDELGALQERLQLSYAPGGYPGCVTLLLAREEHKRRLRATLLGGRDLGWARLARGGARVILVPGGHLSILRKPDVYALAEHLRCCLDLAQDTTDATTESEPGSRRPLAVVPPPHSDKNAEAVWRVVVNHQGQYSLWPVAQPCPPGWCAAGATGTRADCLAHIREVWIDLRPLTICEDTPMAQASA
jgi:amino acid adenylation domain-containing protein